MDQINARFGLVIYHSEGFVWGFGGGFFVVVVLRFVYFGVVFMSFFFCLFFYFYFLFLFLAMAHYLCKDVCISLVLYHYK